MIYANFLYFIIAIAALAMAPAGGGKTFTFPMNLYGILLIFFGFVHYNRSQFSKLRIALESQAISLYEAKKRFLMLLNRHFGIAVALFALDIYLLDLKRLLIGVPGLGHLESFINGTGILIFAAHLVVIWYWSYRAMGDIIVIGKSAAEYVVGNLKFNLAIIVPWLLFMGLHDFLDLGGIPIIVQVSLFIIFMIIVAILAPVVVVRLWDCEPMEDSELKREILAYCKSQGVKFKEIMSWNALNRSLVTAGVMGLVFPFRYLLITPELMRILDKDELMAVVSHEVGHVKKKHLLYYLLFFIGFMLVGVASEMWFFKFVSTPMGLQWYMSLNPTLWSIIQIVFTLGAFVLYFRFIFGFYIRNFERQADVYCFESGVDPNHMVTSFMKLGVHVGDNGKKKNWHHYNIPQRIDFINRCREWPGHIEAHNKKIKRGIIGFSMALILFILFILYPVGYTTTDQLNLHQMESAIFHYIKQEPQNFKWYTMLGMVSFELQKWSQTRDAYEKSLNMKYAQPEALNNLAWFYLKCPEKKYLDERRALKLAEDAVRLQQAAHIFDTLAEAYFQNGRYKEAYIAAKRAYELATENLPYFKEQLQKMEKFANKSSVTYTI